MGTVKLVAGVTTIRKNGAFAGNAPTTLTYDEELGIFKVVQVNGNIWTTFTPKQVGSLSTSAIGGWRKNYYLHISAKFPNGDEYAFSYNTGTPQQAANAHEWVSSYVRKEDALTEVVTRMRTRERVPLSDVASILTSHGLPSGDVDCQKAVEYGITKGGIDGVIDGTEFVSKFALNREQVRYNIVSTFEVGKDGAVVLKCPGCGASIPLQSKDESKVCKYCGTSYTVPRNILKLI